MSGLPPVFIEFLGSATGFHATAKGVRTELAAVETQGGGNMARLGAVSKAALLGIGVAAAVTAVKTVHMAADFETQMTRVRTGAGELAGNMGMVSKGILSMAGQVGQSTQQLTSGLYMVESAGYHGADALNVLKVSAQGAKVGAAELPTVVDAVTTAMNAYKLKASDTTAVMNALVATEASGKTNMEALSGSMSKILPVAAAAHVGMNEVLGAMATMTMQGTSADVAATYLRQTIGMLSNPTAKAANEMKSLGLTSLDVSKNLGTNGLASTLTMLTDAIAKHMGPQGTVLIEKLKAASTHATTFQKVLANLPPTQQTYIGALATMVGGTKSMMAALQLSGPHMDTFRKNVATIGEHVKAGGKSVEGWADVQKTYNQRMAEAKGAMQALGIEIGQVILPYATKFATYLAESVGFLTRHKVALGAVGIALTGVALGLSIASLASWNFSESLLANPLTWIVVAIVAVVAALVMLVMHWRQVYTWIQTNTPGVAHAFTAVWSGAMTLFRTVWDATAKTVRAIAEWFNANVLNWLRDRAAEMVAWWHQNSDSIMRVWAATWDIIQTVAKIAWAAIRVGLNNLLSAWNLIWGLVRDGAKLIWSEIRGLVTFEIHLIMNVIALVLDLITGKWSRFWGDLKKLVGQAFNDIVSNIKGVAGSFWTLLVDAGANLIHGLVNGITGAAGLVGSTLSNIAHGAVNAFKSVLGIASPSKVFQQLGIWVNLGLVAGLDGSRSQVDAATKKTETQLMQAYNRMTNMAGQTTGSGKHKHLMYSPEWIAEHKKSVTILEGTVAREGAVLDKLAAQRASIATRLKSAQSNLASLQKQWTTERNSIAAGIMQGTSVVMQPTNGNPLSASDVVGNMQKQMQDAMQFAGNLRTLQKRGLSTDLIQQIAGQGAAQGGATAAALASANKDQLAQLNSMQKGLQGAANSTGAAVADSMYGAGIDSAKGLIRGLQSQDAAIRKQMLKIAESMKAAIKQALGIRSPSTVFHELGTYVSQGLANGINATAHLANSAAGNLLANSLGPTSRPTMGSGSGHVVHNHVQVNVAGSVRSDRELRDIFQEELLKMNGRNSTNGLTYSR